MLKGDVLPALIPPIFYIWSQLTGSVIIAQAVSDDWFSKIINLGGISAVTFFMLYWFREKDNQWRIQFQEQTKDYTSRMDAISDKFVQSINQERTSREQNTLSLCTRIESDHKLCQMAHNGLDSHLSRQTLIMETQSKKLEDISDTLIEKLDGVLNCLHEIKEKGNL